MDISPLVNIVMARDAALPLDGLNTGERLPVRVLEVRDDGRVLVDCGRFRAVADVTFPVSAGDEFMVRVIESKGALRLEVVRPSLTAGPVVAIDPLPTEPAPSVPAPLLRDVQVDAGRLLAALPQGSMPEDEAGLQAAVTRIAELLQPLEPGQGPGVTDRIQDLCRNSGLFLESRLQEEVANDSPAASVRPVNTAAVRRILAADLKAQLSALVHELEAGAPATSAIRESSEMLRSARALLAEIVQQQADITRTTDESRQMTLIHFSLPLSTPQGAARLKVGFPRRKRRGRSGGHRAALLVDLDRLGPVRADLQLAEGLLTADIFVRKAGLKGVVEEHLSELRSGLAPLCEAVRVSVRVSEKKIADFEWEDLRPAVAGRLDVRA